MNVGIGSFYKLSRLCFGVGVAVDTTVRAELSVAPDIDRFGTAAFGPLCPILGNGNRGFNRVEPLKQ